MNKPPCITLTRRTLRLAEQLGRDPETLAEQLLDMAAMQVDWNLANQCHPLAGNIAGNYNPTSEMDRMTVAQIERLEADTGEVAQRYLFTRHCHALGIRVNDDCDEE